MPRQQAHEKDATLLSNTVANFINETPDLDDLENTYASIVTKLRSNHGHDGFHHVKKRVDQAFSSVLQESYTDPNRFMRAVAATITINHDDLLKTLLTKNSEMIDKIPDHRYLLDLAVRRKATYTFEILIDHNLNPLRGNSLSPIAVAACNQGAQQVSSYCKAISEKHGEAVVKQLINERDEEHGRNALEWAILGTSYGKTIKFLISQGADYKTNFRQNLLDALERYHNQTFIILIDANKDNLERNLSEEYLEALSDTAYAHENHSAQLLLLNVIKRIPRIAHGQAQNKIETRISKTQHSAQDIYQICRAGNNADFEILISHTRPSELEAALASFDHEGKSPLFYALDGNCYSALVKTLLDHGANPTHLIDQSNPHFINNKTGLTRDSDGMAIDAASLCIQRKQSDTLGIILRHKSFVQQAFTATEDHVLTIKTDVELLGTIVHEMCLPTHLDRLVIKQFFESIPEDKLNDLKEHKPNRFKSITSRGMYLAPQETTKKLEECFSSHDQVIEFLNNLKVHNEEANHNIERYVSECEAKKAGIKPMEMQRTPTEKDGLLNQENATNYGTSDADIDRPSNVIYHTICDTLQNCLNFITRSNQR